MFNASKYAALYAITLSATHAHSIANTFFARAAAREQLDDAQAQLARMHKSSKFCVDTALHIATRLKAQHVSALLAA